MSDFDPLEVAADWDDGPDIARAVAKASEEHWRRALAAKDAELERVRGLKWSSPGAQPDQRGWYWVQTEYGHDLSASPRFSVAVRYLYADGYDGISDAQRICGPLTPPPDAAEAGEVGGA